jgi:peptide/nickel transport system permease protein
MAVRAQQARMRSKRASIGASLSRSGKVGLTTLILLALVAIFAPVISPYSIHAIVGAPFQAPSLGHLLGLDDAGYDIVSELAWALRISLFVGLASALVSAVVGGTVGITSGYFGGVVQTILLRFTDYFIVIPVIPLMVVVAAVWGPSLTHIILVIGLLQWTPTARMLDAEVRSLRKRTYVERARMLGASHARVITTHVLPHVASLLIANTVLAVANGVFAETALSFLGLGDPTAISLGSMIQDAFARAAVVVGAWWAIVPPGLLVAVIVCSCTLVGRSLEDHLNPRLRASHIGLARFRVHGAPLPEAQ